MDPYSQNSNGTYNDQFTPGGYEKAKLRKLLLLVVGALAAIAIISLAVHFLQPESQQSKYLKSATIAARKQTPNAKVSNLKVADGFALSIVSDPTAEGQANSGNTTIFKVNQDGTMEQIASGSHFSPLDLLELGIPFVTQAKLTGSNIEQIQQNTAAECGYSGGGAAGYSGFDGSFSPDGWQIDSATLNDLEQALSNKISGQNVTAKPGKTIICVNASQKNSNATTSTTTYISIFTLQVEFITSDGTLSTHMVTFATGPNHYRNYTLDGQDIK